MLKAMASQCSLSGFPHEDVERRVENCKELGCWDARKLFMRVCEYIVDGCLDELIHQGPEPR